MHIIGNVKAISFETRIGRNISCTICYKISQFNRNQFLSIERKYTHATKRTNPSGIYNCHGMIFASRRCFIADTQDILNILDDDNYQQIDRMDALPGDIIVYYSYGDAEHSGIVIEKPTPPLYVPYIVSKWSSHAEFIHPANHCPYNLSDIRYYRIYE